MLQTIFGIWIPSLAGIWCSHQQFLYCREKIIFGMLVQLCLSLSSLIFSSLLHPSWLHVVSFMCVLRYFFLFPLLTPKQFCLAPGLHFFSWPWVIYLYLVIPKGTTLPMQVPLHSASCVSACRGPHCHTRTVFLFTASVC